MSCSARNRPGAKHLILRASALLTAQVMLAGTFTGCYIPVSPGCNPEESLPRNDAFFLYVGLRSDWGVASVGIDRTGRSQFRGQYTVWMLTTPGSCRTLPEDDVRLLEETWRRLSETSRPSRARLPEGPFLRVAYFSAGGEPDLSPERTFDLQPGRTGQPPGLEEAARLTLSILARTYGDRFLQEIRAAGLEDLTSSSRDSARNTAISEPAAS